MRLKDSAVWIFGRAMFTIVASSTTMSWASKMMASAADRRLPDFEDGLTAIGSTRLVGGWTGIPSLLGG